MKEAADLLKLLSDHSMSLSVAESLTGGLLADALVQVPGASRVFAGGAVCYQTPTKSAILGVNPLTIEENTVVSAQVAKEMAIGVCEKFSVSCGISTTGVAGPKGEHDPAPVGTVYVGLSCKGNTKTVQLALSGSREEIRREAVRQALLEMREFVAQQL